MSTTTEIAVEVHGYKVEVTPATGEQRERLNRWVEALRSGKYEQTKDALRRNGNYCCLGVACDVSGIGEWTPDDEYFGDESVLSSEVQTFYGLPIDCGFRISFPAAKDLAELNDEGTTFAQIADLIEAKFALEEAGL